MATAPPDTIEFVLDVLDEARMRIDADEEHPERRELAEAIGRYREIVFTLESEGGAPDALNHGDFTQLGDYGFKLLEQCQDDAESHGEIIIGGLLSASAFPLALWIARHGGQLERLETVVNALARHANILTDPPELASLTMDIAEIIQAVTPELRRDMDSTYPDRPWRVLLLNYGIVATRSQDTDLMEDSFQTLVHNMPADAPNFFREGMQQMEELDYPEHVRRVMRKYHEQWPDSRALH